MWNFLHPDSKIIFYANKFCDLIAVNLLTLLFSIPVVTIGTALSSMHYVLLKIYRDTLEGGVFRNFFSAFRENWKQTTPVWLICLVLGIFLGADFVLFDRGLLPLPAIVKYILIVLAVILYFVANWFFILQSRYANPVKVTLCNALLFCFLHFIDTLLIGLLSCASIVLIAAMPQVTPVFLFCGLSLPGVLCAALYSRIFARHEEAAHQSVSKEKSSPTASC